MRWVLIRGSWNLKCEVSKLYKFGILLNKENEIFPNSFNFFQNHSSSSPGCERGTQNSLFPFLWSRLSLTLSPHPFAFHPSRSRKRRLGRRGHAGRAAARAARARGASGAGGSCGRRWRRRGTREQARPSGSERAAQAAVAREGEEGGGFSERDSENPRSNSGFFELYWGKTDCY